jgi:hypothetical protein
MGFLDFTFLGIVTDVAYVRKGSLRMWAIPEAA